ncbi:Ditrans,polycis-undecaprenyl-diphosphate synthase ((2E,6E)-farnesyl-diphosphate specific) [bacterium HR19]|nr:Ditrans,polycis-undecaprenyl-diphosphate synthase ((2E,6E)-farnesyl-diphosphate specific) [bacterium HR19]
MRGLKIPYHVAIIMDGNGRWAQKRNLPRIEGHREGAKSVDDVVETARKIGVKYLTLYAFSKDNWKRPKEEVSALINLLRDYLKKEKERMKKNGIRFNVVGDIKDFPKDVQKQIKEVMEYTKDCEKMTLTLALSYSGKNEIVKAVKKIAQLVKKKKLSPKEICQELLQKLMGLPDVELLIRTSGEMRISDFLLWQISYAELYFTKKLWPDFRGKDLIKAIRWFSKRERRFGMTSEQIKKSEGEKT